MSAPIPLFDVLDFSVDRDGTVYGAGVHEDRLGIASLRAGVGGGLDMEKHHPIHGDLACSICVLPGALAVACYTSGTVAVVETPRSVTNGTRRWGTATIVDTNEYFPHGPERAVRQDRSHPHGVVWSPAARHIVVCDLGGDQLLVIAPPEQSVRVAAILPTGSGPRSAVICADGSLVVSCELDSTIRSFRWNGARYVETAVLQTTCSDVQENLPGSLISWPRDGTLVVANRGNATIAGFRTVGREPRMVWESEYGGRWPAHLASHGNLLFIADSHSDLIAVFRSGPDGPEIVGKIPAQGPVAMAVLPRRP